MLKHLHGVVSDATDLIVSLDFTLTRRKSNERERKSVHLFLFSVHILNRFRVIVLSFAFAFFKFPETKSQNRKIEEKMAKAESFGIWKYVNVFQIFFLCVQIRRYFRWNNDTTHAINFFFGHNFLFLLQINTIILSSTAFWAVGNATSMSA